MAHVQNTAKVIIQKSSGPISNLKLQKLLYYVQGWSLALNDKPAFDARIEAWVHGPVVPEIFYSYRHFGWNPIRLSDVSADIPADETEHVINVLSEYGGFTANQLELMSHEEDPWINARQGLPAKTICQNIITPEAMKAFFSKKVAVA